MRVVKYLAAVCSIVFLGIWLHPAPVQAAPDDGFNVITSPLPINLQTKPGTTTTTDIRVKNGSTKTEKLKVSLMKFSAYGEEGKPSLQDRATGDDYFDWVTFSPSLFDAPPDTWITIKMTIKLPSTAAFGYYYAAVISRGGPAPTTNGKENVLIGSTAVLVLVDAQVPGANRTASISSFTANKSFYEFLPANFTVKIHNSGNVHLKPTGNIFISRGGKTVATLDVNSVSGNVLPSSNRIFTTAWSDGFPVYTQKMANGKTVLDKNDKPVTSLTWDFSKTSHLKFGHYTAHLVMAYDNGTRDVPMEATVQFWVVPWRIFGGSLLLLILASSGLWSFVSKIYRKLPKRKVKAKIKNEKPTKEEQ
jgi:hypothetical protein